MFENRPNCPIQHCEQTYAYILSRQKLSKNAKNDQFGETLTRQVHFDRKMPNLKNWNVYFCILEYYGHFRHFFKRDKQMYTGNDEDCRIWDSSLTIIGLQSRRAIVMLLSSLLL